MIIREHLSLPCSTRMRRALDALVTKLVLRSTLRSAWLLRVELELEIAGYAVGL